MRRLMSQVVPGVVLVACTWSGWAGAAVLRVDPNDPNAFVTIGAAVAAAASGDTIVVASGRYRGAGNRDVAPAGKSLSLRSEGGAERCVIDCEGRGPAFVLDTGRPGLMLDGFTITGGQGSTGGAICASSAGMLTLLDCVFVGNHATESGGAVYIPGCRAEFSNCTFRDNQAINNGGAIMADARSSLLLEDCTVLGNEAGRHGGGLGTLGWNCLLRRCAFSGNHTRTWGGGASFYGAVHMSNCVFSGNSALHGGGAVYATGAATVMHCTFAHNTSDAPGGAWMSNKPKWPVDVYGSIFWGNRDQAGQGASAQVYQTRLEAVYSCIQNWPAIPTVNSEDPQFADANGPDDLSGTADDDLSLRPGSPCIDAGFLTTASWPFDLDRSRRPRFAGRTIDLGAYEFRAEAVPPEPVGAWQPEPVVISEVLAHSPATRDWVELQNLTDRTLDITGWQIEDRQQNLFTFGPDTRMEPRGYLVVYQGTQLPFGFEARGDVITLCAAVQGIPTSLAQSHVLRGTLTDMTLVRHVNSVGSVELAPSAEPTLGNPNAAIVMSPVVITEIMYAPDGIAPARYVEIANATAAPVALTDTGAGLSWMLGEYPSCRIPLETGMVLSPGGRLLFAEDPNTLVQVYPDIPPEVKIVGPWTGFLPYEAGKVSLYAPNVPDRRWVAVDSVTYNVGSPLLQDHWDRYWELTANGQGDSLHRRSLTAYANDPNNWEAGPPTPGY